MKQFFKCLGDMCCNCMAHLQEEFRKFKECRQLPLCDCEVQCKKEQANSDIWGSLLLVVCTSLGVLLIMLGMIYDVSNNNWDYQFHLADSFQKLIIACAALAVYYAKHKENWFAKIQLLLLVASMVGLIWQYGRIQGFVSEEKAQSSVYPLIVKKRCGASVARPSESGDSRFRGNGRGGGNGKGGY